MIVKKNPSPQTALDIFEGDWVSKMPSKFSSFTAGSLPLFEDPRVPMSEPHLGKIKGKKVLDLGPLEGGQAYVLEQMGAKSIVSVEANSLLYLRCLVAKEVLGMKKVRFLCGDVIEFLKHNTTAFDMCVCSGILYHMTNPVELLRLLSGQVDQLLIWTHYFDEVDNRRNHIAFRNTTVYEIQGVSYDYHHQEYGAVFNTNVYCGGTDAHSNWMSKSGILTALGQFGYIDRKILQDGDSSNGPFLLITAKK